MERTPEKISFPVLPILMILITIVLLIFGSSLFTTPQSEYFTQLYSGWSVYYGDKVYNDVTLADFALESTNAGDIITIKRTIPATTIVSPTIMFKSYLASVLVEMDGKEVYSFGSDISDKGIYIPKKFNLITFSDWVKAHDVSITFKVAEKNSFRGFYPIYFGTKTEVVKYFFKYHRMPLFLGGFFIIYSLLLFSLGLFLFMYHRFEESAFISSAVSMLLGLYTYTYNDIFAFLSEHEYFFSLMEYFVLYLIPLSFSVLLYTTNKNIIYKKQRVIIGINIVLPIIFWMCFLTGMIPINLFVVPVQIVSVLEIIIILPPLVSNVRMRHKKKVESDTYTGVDSDSYLIMGFIIMVVFALLEIAKYTVQRFAEGYGKQNLFVNINFLNLGMLFFIICLFVYYFLSGIEHMNDQRIKEKLEGLAYTDALTGLMNRAKCMQYGATLKGDYAIISLDVDRLKYVNDTYGHLEGDRMLKTFANYLTESFKGAGLIGRTGGDEFLVIFEKPSADVCDKCIRVLEKNMDDFNRRDDKFKLSASAGYAYSYEAGGRMSDVFYLADSRMYKMKEKHHE